MSPLSVLELPDDENGNPFCSLRQLLGGVLGREYWQRRSNGTASIRGVCFTRTSDLVLRLQVARRELRLTQEIARLDRFDLLILDDLSYVRRDQAETSVLFELIAERYERKSLALTANQPFSGWDQVFAEPAMTLAAVDRLVHYSTIFELNNVESYRSREAAREAARKQARPGSEKKPENMPIMIGEVLIFPEIFSARWWKPLLRCALQRLPPEYKQYQEQRQLQKQRQRQNRGSAVQLRVRKT